MLIFLRKDLDRSFVEATYQSKMKNILLNFVLI